MDRISIILGISLLIASIGSYVVIEAYGQQNLIELNCPENAYHGLDNQGNEACRDIQTNQVLEPKSEIITDSEKTKSDSKIINDPKTGGIILNDEQPQIIEIIIFALIVIVGSIVGVSAKKGKLKIFQKLDLNSIINAITNEKLKIFQKRGWSNIQKEQVRNRQYDKCNMCFTEPSQWKYDYINGNKSDNELNNCQGLCSNCYSVKTEKIIHS